MIFIKIIFLLLAFLGFSLFIKEKFSVDTVFIPFIYVSTLSSLVYILAMLSMMKEGVYIFHISFFVIFFYYIYKKKDIAIIFKDLYLFFIIGLLLTFYLYNKEFIHYDNFSHWGRISRFLIENDRINDSRDTIISFNSYPQMSAYFIYGLTRPLGFSENYNLIANALAIFSGYFVFYKACKKSILNTLMFCIFSIYIFFDNISIDTLLVDTLISTSSFALFSFIYEYTFNKKDKNYYLLFPMFIFVTLIKNSSIYFSMIAIAYLCIRNRKDNIKIAISCFLTTLFSQKIWSNHVKHTFDSLGKHSMNLTEYRNVFGEKNKSDIINITKSFIQAVFDDKIIFILLLIIIVAYFCNKRSTILKKLLIFTVVSYALYQLGNYFMYIFSMPKGEALQLAGYGRYLKTIRFYLILVVSYIIFLNYKTFCSKIMIWGLMIYLTLNPLKALMNKNTDKTAQINKNMLEKYRDENNIGANKNILVKMKEKDGSYYYAYMGQYIFRTNTVKITYINNEEKINKNDYDYFIDLSK